MTELSANRPHYPALDGLRGLAILLVVLYHNFNFINYSIFGWIGVDLFFVLSGFLITGLLLNSLESKHYIRNFFGKRILRIFPLYYLCLVIFIVILPSFSPYKSELQYYVENQAWFWFYLQNWLLSFNFPRTNTVLNHFWSLGVEEQFYLVWPFIILWLRKPKKLLVFILVILLLLLVGRSVVWMCRFPHLNYTTLYTFTRIDGICIGCIIALLHKINYNFLRNNIAIIVIALAVMNFGFYFLSRTGDFPYLAFAGYTTFAALFGLLVHEAVTGDTKIINVIFRNPILKFFGVISYGFYVFHWPVYSITQPEMHRFFLTIQLTETMSRLVASVIATLIALILSIISYYALEINFLKLKRKLK